MNYAIVENEKITNTIVAEKEFAEFIGAIYYGELPIGIGDNFINNQFVKTIIDYDEEGKACGEHCEYFNIPDIVPITPPQELREQAYESMLYKEDGTALITWDGIAITVDQANKKWLDYSAEGSEKANELSAIIVSAKDYIRQLYPE